MEPDSERQRPLIVVADDDAELLTAIRQVLESQGFGVVTAQDGQEAMVAIRRQKPALVIADVMMPKLDGFQLCRIIKFDQHLKAIPVILLTARRQEVDRYTGREVRADDYLTKPFKTHHLLSRVTHWLTKVSG